jgi:hypothetical protein
MSFKEFLPTSCEVFVLPLVCIYVIFVGILPHSIWGALVGPGIWFVIVSLEAIVSYTGNKDHWLLIKRTLLILGCLLPMALFLYWAWITGRLDKV